MGVSAGMIHPVVHPTLAVSGANYDVVRLWYIQWNIQSLNRFTDHISWRVMAFSVYCVNLIIFCYSVIVERQMFMNFDIWQNRDNI